MLDQLRQIAIFSKTVELGSFRKAATALHLSPSVVSHHIARLEEELDVALLYRSTRKLSLTSEGKKLLISAQSMMESAEEFFSAATNQSAQLIGELTISLPAVLQQSNLVNHIGDFAKQHPSINLQLDFSDLKADLIGDGIDISIRMGWLEDSGLKARKLYDVERCVAASPSYINSKPNQITLDEIETWDWIELAPVGLINLFTLPKDTKNAFRPKSKLRVNSANAMHQLLLNGNGIAALPKFLIEDDLESGKLVRILPELESMSLGVYAVWPANAPKGGLTSRFVEFLKLSIDK